ncbi:hypothetical protein AX14_013490 [Amanita brunnescens Koide BX004]|nr:hypothetical protein AX14_013490 [Amanita brunnescens Koide BX004]
MSYQGPFDFPGPAGESYSTTPTTPLEGLDFQLPQWETVERERQQQQQQRHQEQPRQLSYTHSQPPTPTAHNTIQLDEQASAAAPHPPPARVVPSQMHLETGSSLQLHAYHGHGHEGRSGLINTISPTAPTPTSGLVARPTRARAEAHPYKRPQSAIGTKTPTIPLRQLQEGGSRRHASSSMQAVRSASGGSSRSTATVAQRHGSGPPSPDPETYEEPGKSYVIRADVHVDPESKVFTALLELPGVRKDEVRVTLSSCLYNGVKQVSISGRTRDPFASSEGGRGLGKIVRERKYGRFIRTFAVSSDTKVRLIFESVRSRRSRATPFSSFCGDLSV